METTVLRKELKSYIDALPDYKLQALKPLLTVYCEPLYTIDTDLTAEEIAEVDERVAEYHKDPASWVPLENL
ncbi:hypothetical protein FACS1894130_13220 [Spirochaetia bacterium]|nr:hypothetical protein FACS1894130_13220 [Spirochaetia bacterium]